MERNSWLRALIVILVFISALYLIGLLYNLAARFGDIILLFFLAWLLAFALRPVVRLLECLHLPRFVAALLTYLGLLMLAALVGLMIVPNIAFQLNQLGQDLPTYVKNIPETVVNIQIWLGDHSVQGVNFTDLTNVQSLVSRAEAIGTLLAQNALGIAQGLATLAFNWIIIMIISFYFMLDGDRIGLAFFHLLPDRYEAEAMFFFDSVGKSFGGFMRGIVLQAVINGIGTAVVMWVAGLHYVALVSIVAGVVMIIPFFGTFIALVPPIALAALTLSWGTVIFVAVALLALQQVLLNVIAPKVMSNSVGIHPILVFLAMLVGLREAGIWGAIFGVPIMAVVYSMALFFYGRAFPAKQIGQTPVEQTAITVLSRPLEEK
ncbi:MAG: AI-2E family transporter [Dehalococcoidia bacterium]|nr:AI-2E family transporter [Dehalococcoidia bacterium]